MKRLHVHVSVDNLTDSIKFYSGMFGAEPTVAKPDYAKWKLEDPQSKPWINVGCKFHPDKCFWPHSIYR